MCLYNGSAKVEYASHEYETYSQGVRKIIPLGFMEDLKEVVVHKLILLILQNQNLIQLHILK